MEKYLVLLFLLFSIASALLERRKRARQLEEARQAREARLERERQQGGQFRPEPEPVPEKEEEEEVWPFPMGGDPFEPRRPGRRARAAPAAGVEVGEPMPPLRARGRDLIEALEQQARQIEERACREEGRARKKAQQARKPRQRVQELVRQRLEKDQAGPRRHRKVRGKWVLNPRAARDAIVWAEILGPPKAERTDELWRQG